MREKLASMPMLEGIDETLKEKAIDGILGISEEFILESGKPLFAPDGESKHNMYLLLSGRLTVQNKETGNTISREMLVPSNKVNVVGEIAWSLKSKRTADLVARGNAQLLRIDGARLDEYLAENTDIGYPFMRNMAILLAQRMCGMR